MCGITGYVGYAPDETLQRMTDAVASRGPDGQGKWIDRSSQVFFGHRRLSVLDHSGGAQPMVSHDEEVVIIFNGEIYNFAELRAELAAKGHRFLSDHSDTETLLVGYREWGPNLPERLNGMWAFVVYDRRRQTLFASRDRFGKKPLYYATHPRGLIFGSTLAAVRQHPDCPSAVSRRALQKYFGYGYIPAPLSLIDGVSKLPGGHSFTYQITSRTLEVRRYWEFKIEPFDRVPADPEREWGEILRAKLDAAVKRRLVADVPVGVFLSGGIDSSLITAFAARHVPQGKLATFSIGFEEASFDESDAARRTAALFKTSHHEDILSMDRAVDIFPEVARALDEPMADSSLLPTYLLSRFTRQHVTVALGGDGGDELFAGYDPFKALRAAKAYQTIVPRPIHTAISLLATKLPVSHRNLSFDFKVKRTLRGVAHPARLWLPVWMAPLSPSEMGELFNAPIDPEDLYSEAIAAWESTAPDNLVDRTLQFFTRLYLQDDILAKVDRATMMVGLEARAPLLDIEVVDFVRRIPAAWKYRNGETKYLLKRALESVLPCDILYRSKKGFGVPIGAWLRNGALSVAPDKTAAFGLNPKFISREWEAHRRGARDQRLFLWSLALLQSWQKHNLAVYA
jgi:asparagine synthase (glutamine-hydrolysing)